MHVRNSHACKEKCNQPNQQRTLNKLPTELRCKDFVTKHRLNIQTSAKMCKNVYARSTYSNWASILHTAVGGWEGKASKNSSVLPKEQKWSRSYASAQSFFCGKAEGSSVVCTNPFASRGCEGWNSINFALVTIVSCLVFLSTWEERGRALNCPNFCKVCVILIFSSPVYF